MKLINQIMFLERHAISNRQEHKSMMPSLLLESM